MRHEPRGKPFTGTDDPRRHPGFEKGTSGNPGGLTREVAAARDEARTLAALESPKAIKALTSIIDAPRDDAADVIRAAGEILDRGLGKPAQRLEHEQVIDWKAQASRIVAILYRHERTADAIAELKATLLGERLADSSGGVKIIGIEPKPPPELEGAAEPTSELWHGRLG